jgi:inner membrane transporter RhtA
VVTANVQRATRRARPWALPVRAARQGLGSVPPPALVLAGIVSVQLGASFAKQLFPVAGAVGVVSMRLVFAAVILLAVWRPSLRGLDRQAWLVIGLFGAVLGTMNVLFYESLNRIPLGVAVTVEFLGPLAVALAGSRRWLDAVWAVLAGGGVVLLTDGGGHVEWFGVLLALGAACCWGCYILLSAKLGRHTSGGGGLALAMAVGGVLVAPFGFATSGAELLRPQVLAIGFGVALLSSVVPYSVELEALRRIPPRVFGVLMSLEPAVAAFCGLLLLGQALRPVQWIAVCLVVGASVGATRANRTAT